MDGARVTDGGAVITLGGRGASGSFASDCPWADPASATKFAAMSKRPALDAMTSYPLNFANIAKPLARNG